MSVEKVHIYGDWHLYVALYTDVSNTKELRQSVVDGRLDIALISPTLVGCFLQFRVYRLRVATLFSGRRPSFVVFAFSFRCYCYFGSSLV